MKLYPSFNLKKQIIYILPHSIKGVLCSLDAAFYECYTAIKIRYHN